MAVWRTQVCSDATNITLTGVNHLGQTVSETIAIPNGGNATVTSTNWYRSVTSFSVPAQTGTGGTATVGIAALDSIALADFCGVVIRKPIKTTIPSSGLYGYPGITSTSVPASFVDGETLSLCVGGGIWVYTEEAVTERDPVYVRITSGAGGSTLGAFRNDADTASCVLIPDARFTRSAAAGCARIYLPHQG